MSYFATAAGVDLEGAQVDGLAFTRVADAQLYVARLAPKIARADGEPVYLCDDMHTGTSDDFVASAVTFAAENGTLNQHPILELLSMCHRTGAVLRVWWANDEAMAFEHVQSFTSIPQAVQFMLNVSNPTGWNFRYAP